MYETRKSTQRHKLISEYVPGGVYSNFSHKPHAQIYFSHAQGCRLFDLDGNEYLDMYGGSGAFLLGYNHPIFEERFRAYVDKAKAKTADVRALELLSTVVPSCEMMRFCLSGTEAIQNAIRLSRAYTGRIKILRFEGHYHGNADNIMGGYYDETFFPEPCFDSSDPHHCEGTISSLVREQMLILPWNNIELFTKTMKQYGKDIAAVIMEPISVNAGSIMPNVAFLKAVRVLSEQYGCLLIFDEVITGFRVSLGGAQELLGITPDITILGKALGGGEYPVSALVGKKDILELYSNRKVIHGGTFNGYYIGQCAICATIETLQEVMPYEGMLSLVQQMHRCMLSCAEAYDIPFSIQGHPSCASFHCKKNEVSEFRQIDNGILLANSIVRDVMQSYGILTAPVSRIYPSIVYSIDDLLFLEERIDDIMKTAKILLERVLNSRAFARSYFFDK